MIGGDTEFEQVVAKVVSWASWKRLDLGLDLPLDVRGTAFQQRVWQALREIAKVRALFPNLFSLDYSAPY